jgi:hypothetical protein
MNTSGNFAGITGRRAMPRKKGKDKVRKADFVRGKSDFLDMEMNKPPPKKAKARRGK